MISSIFSRSTVARFAIVGMVLAAVTVTGPSASADSGPVSASSYRFVRAADGTSLLFRAGEQGQLVSEARLSNEYSGWPVANNTVFTRTAFSLKRPPAGILPDYPLEVTRYWSGSEWSEQENTCEGVWEMQKTLTINSTTNCINNLTIRDEYYLENQTDGPLMVNTNFSSQVVSVGKKGRKSKAISASNGLTNQLFGDFSVYNEEYVSLTADDGTLQTDFSICIDESLVDAEDVLAVDYELSYTNLSNSTSTVSSDDFFVYEGDGGEWGTWDLADESNVTYSISEVPSENLVLGLTVYMQNDDTYEDPTQAGTYSGTVDVLNTSNGNASVTEPCGPLGGSGWNDPSVVAEPAGSPGVTATPLSWNASGMTPSDNADQYVGYSDSFGGMWFSEYPTASDGEVALAHLGEGGVSGGFNGTGTRLLTLGEDGGLDITSFGPNGGNYATLTKSSRSAWTLTTNSKVGAAANISSYSVTVKSLTKLCPSRYSVDYVFGISAPTTSLMGYLYCSRKDVSSTSIIKFEAGVPKLVTRLGSPSSRRPCVASQWGIDTRASGGDAALILYTRTSSYDSNGYCGTTGSTVSARTLTTIDTAGVPVTTSVSSNPWGSDGEPGSLQIAAGETKGTWIGLTGYYNDDYWGLTPGNLFTIEGSIPAVTLGEPILLDETNDIGSENWSIVPVKEVSPTQWLVSGQGISEFDSERFHNSSIGTLDTETGQIAWGDMVKSSNFGYWPGNQGQFSGGSDEIPALYVITDFVDPNFFYKTYSWGTAP